MTFIAHEYDISSPLRIEPTGRKFTYEAPDIETAVESVLYTERLSNGNAFIGPKGRVVYSGPRALSIVKGSLK